MKNSDTDNALKHAKLEYERRPENIDVCEALAWVNYKKGDFKEANKFINNALKTNSKNPILLCRAGMIKIKAGEEEKGEKMIQQAFEINPFIADISIKNEASSLTKSELKN